MRVTIYHLNIGMITMNKILPAIAVIIALGLSAMYFTNAQPTVEAMTEGESSMMFTIYQRVKNIEEQKKVTVPKELKLKINGELEK